MGKWRITDIGTHVIVAISHETPREIETTSNDGFREKIYSCAILYYAPEDVVQCRYADVEMRDREYLQMLEHLKLAG